MRRRLVGQHDLGVGRIGCPHDSGQRGECLGMVGAGAAQSGVEIGRGDHHSTVGRGAKAVRSGRFGSANGADRVAGPGAGFRARVHLDAQRPVLGSAQLGGQLRVLVQRQHLLDGHLGLDGVGGPAQRLAAGREHDLGEAGARHHRQPVDQVVSQPRMGIQTDVGLPDVSVARRKLHMHSEQRMRPGELVPGRTVGHPVGLVLPRGGRYVGQVRAGGAVGQLHRGRPDRRELSVERHRLRMVAVDRRAHVEGAAGGLRGEGVADRVRQQRMGADLDEVGVIGAGFVHRLAEAHRITQVGRPVVRAVQRFRTRVGHGRDQRDLRRGRAQVGQRLPQLRQHRVDRRMVRRDVHLDTTGELALRVDDGDEFVDLCRRARDHRLLRRRIDRDGDLGPVGDELLRRGGVEFHQRHRTLSGQPLHQPRPGGDDVQSLCRSEHAGHHGRGRLSHRVADHRIRLDAVRAPQRGQRQLHPDQHGLDAVDADDGLAGFQRLAQREADLVEERGFELVDGSGEGRLLGQQRLAHAGPLRALAGVQEHSSRTGFRVVDAGHTGSGLTGRHGAQTGDGLGVVTRGHRGDAVVAAAVVVEGERDVTQWDVGAHAVEPLRQHQGRGRDAGRGLAGDDQGGHRRPRTRLCGNRFRALLQHDVGIGAAHAERRHRRAARVLGLRPLAGLRGHEQPGARRVDARIPLLEVAVRRDRAVLQGQDGLDEPGDAGRGFEVAHVGLDRAERARSLALAVDSGQRVELDRVTQTRSGAVGFDVAHGSGGDVGRAQRPGHHVPL